jgi:peptidoglycan/xylan/chitin deacetylase (PgdA/CDA1 family)
MVRAVPGVLDSTTSGQLRSFHAAMPFCFWAAVLSLHLSRPSIDLRRMRVRLPGVWRIRHTLRRLRRAFASLICLSGALALWRQRRSSRPGPVILMYHSIGGVGLSPDIVVSTSNFHAHIDHLHKHYRLASLDEIVQLLQSGREVPLDTVAVTFDDGYRDNFENAFPILQRYECPATLFIAVEPVDHGCLLWPQVIWNWLHHTSVDEVRISWRNRNQSKAVETVLDLRNHAARARARSWLRAFVGGLEPEDRADLLALLSRQLRVSGDAERTDRSPMLTWEEIRRMHAAGVTIGSHSMTHPRLSGLELHRVHDEVFQSRTRLESELGTSVHLFAYPFGRQDDFDEHSKLAVRRAGYQAACISEDTTPSAAADLLALPRLHVPDEPAWRFAVRLLLTTRDSRFLRWLLDS